MRPALLCLPAALLALAATPARAQTVPAAPTAPRPPVQLTYTRGSAAKDCGDEGALRQAIIKELLRRPDPFEATAALQLTVSIDRRADELVADFEERDEAGRVVWGHKSIKTTSPCSSLIKTLALVIAMWLDKEPEAPVAPVPAALPACAPVPAPACAPAPAAPALPAPRCEPAPAPQTTWEPPPMWAPPSAKPGLGFRVGAAAWAERFAVDGGSFGLTVDAGVRYGWFSAALEVHVDPPLGPVEGPGASLNGVRVTGALLPCLHYGYLAACGKAEAGWILFPGYPAQGAARAYDAVGLRLNLEFPTGAPSLFVRLGGEVLFAINPGLLMQPGSGKIEYQTVGTGGGLGLGLLYAR